MDKNGIGTDATIHEHIHKLLMRSYALKHSGRFLPTRLGVALVLAYDALGLDVSLTQPKLRAALEGSLGRVCTGEMRSEVVMQQMINQFIGVFERIQREFQEKMMPLFREYLGGAGVRPLDPMERGAGRGIGGGRGGGGGRGNGDDSQGDDDDDEENHDQSNSRKRSRKTTNAPAKTTAKKRGSNTTPSTKRKSSSATSTTSLAATIECNCKAQAVLKTVTKSGPNTGRTFWTCGKGGGNCEFFSWADEGSNGTNSGTLNTSNTSNGNNYRNTSTTAGEDKECGCGLIMIQGEFKKGPNAGRAFLKCPKIVGKCGAFEFLDGFGNNEASNSNNLNRGTNRSANRNISNRNGSNSKSKTTSTTAGKCFKCNQSGHWANACPNG